MKKLSFSSLWSTLDSSYTAADFNEHAMQRSHIPFTKKEHRIAERQEEAVNVFFMHPILLKFHLQTAKH